MRNFPLEGELIEKSDADLYNKYQNMVAGLAKPGEEILKTLTPEKCHLWHMASCLMCETLELMEVIYSIQGPKNYCQIEHLIEEMGDCEFYFEGILARLENRTFFETFSEDMIDNNDLFSKLKNESLFIDQNLSNPEVPFTIHLSIASSYVFDALKKHIIYNAEMDKIRLAYWIQKYIHVRDLFFTGFSAYDASLSRKNALQKNYEKLSKRYQGLNYSDKAAQERADKKNNNF